MVALFELGARGAADAVRTGEQTAEARAERWRAARRRHRGERLGPLYGVPLALEDGCDREKRFPSPEKS